MLKNSEIRRLLFINLTAIVLLFIVSIIASNIICRYYKNDQIRTNSYIVGGILEKHPELESEIIASLVSVGNEKLGIEILEKYELTTFGNINNDAIVKSNIFKLNLTILIFGLITMFMINYLFITKMYKKIKKIDKYMVDILNGDYGLDIKDYCEGDISNLKNDTYKMTVRLREQSELLKCEKKYLEELLEDISHQLKTPLTSMYMINDIISHEKDKNKRQEFLNQNEQQLNRIEWLITSLLKISRLDSGTVKLKLEKVKLKDLIDKAIKPIKELIKSKNIDFKVNIIDEYINVDLNWTSEALLNIIKNACEHTTDKVEIKTFKNPIYTEIVVSDNGKGINKKDLPHIFERFYKGEHNKDSIGIGLNMAQKIVNLENGKITVETSNRGTNFSIKIFKNNI